MRRFQVVGLLLFVAGCGSSEPGDGGGLTAATPFDGGKTEAGLPGDGGADTGPLDDASTDTSVDDPAEASTDARMDDDATTGSLDAGADAPTNPPVDGGGGSLGNGPPKVTLGEAFKPSEAPDGQWKTVDFPDAVCLNNGKGYIATHLNRASKKFAIYLEGGGGCFNDATCAMSGLIGNMPGYTLGGGIFNFNKADNPIRDWNIFYIPYCSGDAYAGDNPDGNPGQSYKHQKFAGYKNLQLYLARILATMDGATDELVTGISAGGYGAGLTISLMAGNAPASVERFTVIDDSGPPLSSKYITPCLQDIWRTVWGLDNTALQDCGAACTNKDDFISDLLAYYVNRYAKGSFGPKFRAGLISNDGDDTIRTFLGYGLNDCPNQLFAPKLTEADFKAGLLEFRTRVQGMTDSFGTYYMKGTGHTIMASDTLYSMQVGGTKLLDWVNDLLAHDKAAAHVGP